MPLSRFGWVRGLETVSWLSVVDLLTAAHLSPRVRAERRGNFGTLIEMGEEEAIWIKRRRNDFRENQ